MQLINFIPILYHKHATNILIASCRTCTLFKRAGRHHFQTFALPAPVAVLHVQCQPQGMSWRKDGKPIWASYKYNVKTTDSSCVLEVLNSDRLEAVGRYSWEISNSENAAICYAQVKLDKTLDMKSRSERSLFSVFKTKNLLIFDLHLKNKHTTNIMQLDRLSYLYFLWLPHHQTTQFNGNCS